MIPITYKKNLNKCRRRFHRQNIIKVVKPRFEMRGRHWQIVFNAKISFSSVNIFRINVFVWITIFNNKLYEMWYRGSLKDEDTDYVALKIVTYKPRGREQCKHTQRQVYQKSTIQVDCSRQRCRLAPFQAGKKLLLNIWHEVQEWFSTPVVQNHARCSLI